MGTSLTTIALSILNCFLGRLGLPVLSNFDLPGSIRGICSSSSFFFAVTFALSLCLTVNTCPTLLSFLRSLSSCLLPSTLYMEFQTLEDRRTSRWQQQNSHGSGKQNNDLELVNYCYEYNDICWVEIFYVSEIQNMHPQAAASSSS
ncbi:uncharacterized protein LOC122322518 isoform X1 [Drosophila grimshawi]|uniref:uncharacterized protein LOC122322518 isoform X1 n=1 Tax=Drosophila grimshawi TaxID=7222 RepID=UPI001C931A29|nr:uncharacterized protein LOC122322518 isoform X1 [Drosophila grimshawi]